MNIDKCFSKITNKKLLSFKNLWNLHHNVSLNKNLDIQVWHLHSKIWQSNNSKKSLSINLKVAR